MLPHIMLMNALRTIFDIVAAPVMYFAVIWVGTFFAAPEANEMINAFFIAMFLDTFGFAIDWLQSVLYDWIVEEVNPF